MVVARWTEPSGWAFELIVLDGQPRLRLTRHRVHIRDCRDEQELVGLLAEQGVSLADFEEEPSA